MTAIYIYKILHLLGAFMVFIGFGALIARTTLAPDNKTCKKLGSITSGIGLFLILLGGFGLIARYNLSYVDWWLLTKMVIWVAIGGLTVVANKMPKAGLSLWIGLLVLGAVAASLGLGRSHGIFKATIVPDEPAATEPSE